MSDADVEVQSKVVEEEVVEEVSSDVKVSSSGDAEVSSSGDAKVSSSGGAQVLSNEDALQNGDVKVDALKKTVVSDDAGKTEIVTNKWSSNLDDVSSTPQSSIVTMTKFMNKKMSHEPDSLTSSTRLTSSVKIDEEDLDKEIAARMAALSSGSSYKPSTYSFLSDSYGLSTSSPYTSTLTSRSAYAPSSDYTSSAYSTTSSSPYLSDFSQKGSTKSLYDTRIRDLEKELESEKTNRVKGEKLRVDLQKEVNILKEKLEDAQDALHKQMDQNKKREMQLQNLSRALDESQTQGETQLANFKKKHQETVGQLMDQIDELHRNKQKSEKEKLQIQVELDGLKQKTEDSKTAKQQSEKHIKSLEDQVKDLNLRLTHLQKETNEAQSQKSKSQIDASDARRKIEDLEKELLQANGEKEDATKAADEYKVKLRESEEKGAQLSEENRLLQEEVASLKEEREDDKERQSELQKRLNKAAAEVTTWQQKCQNNEASIRPEDVEELKKKFLQKLQESEAKVDATIGKMVALDKARGQAHAAAEALKDEIDKLQTEISIHEKRHKQSEKIIDDWKKKVEDLQNEIEEANKEAKNEAEATIKTGHQLDEAKELSERLKRENKNLSAEVTDLQHQLDHSNQKLLDLEKTIKRLETEKQELNNVIAEKDLSIQKEAAKLVRAQQDVVVARDDFERRVCEKDDEMDEIRKSHNKTLANIQASLDAETKNKLEALRGKKELEQKVSDLELAIERNNKSRGDTDKIHKKYQQQLIDLQALFEDEEQMRKKAEEELQNQTQKSEALKDEVDVLRLQVDSLDRNRRMLESELKDAAAKINELNVNCSNLSALKKKLENNVQHSRSENEDHQLNMRRLEDALKKANNESNQVTEELKREQAKSGELEKVRRLLELQIKDLQARLDSTEQMAVSGGKAAWVRIEQRVHDLETELESERLKNLEKDKSIRKQERKLQELDLHSEEQQRTQARLNDLIEKMQVKIKGYKKLLDDAEQLSEMNLAKYRKMQSDLEEAETRANVAEKLIDQLRSRAIQSVTASDDVSTFTTLAPTKTTRIVRTTELE